MNTIHRLFAALIIAGCSVAATSNAFAAKWEIDQREGTGKCSTGKGGKYCHNCLGSGGDHTEWEFYLKCDSKPTNLTVKIRLDCTNEGKHFGDKHGEEHKHLVKLAEQELKKPRIANANCPKK